MEYNSDLTWMLGGPQGGGINTAAEAFAKALTRGGYRIHMNIEYHSNIMGEHSYYTVRISDQDKGNLSEKVHVLVSLDEETLLGNHHNEWPSHHGHLHKMVAEGVVIYDGALKMDLSGQRQDINYIPVPFDDLLRKVLTEAERGNEFNALRVMTNSVAGGASAAALGVDLVLYQQSFRGGTGRRAALAELNAAAAAAGYNFVMDALGGRQHFRLVQATPPAQAPLLMRGVQAVALAKLKAGLQFQTYYPISPATDENVYLEANQRTQDLTVVQVEDEISAINMAVGAAHAGVRSSTSTSGPGLSLMCEGFGFASITESAGPVVYLWQRGGPSTGLPTRSEQADLLFALQPGHGDFAHMVVAPGDIPQTVEDSYEAFNWADRYQLPVIVMVDKRLQSSHFTVDDLGLDRLPPIDRGPRFSPNGDYLRYKFTDSGVSPRAVPGQEGGIFWVTTDEHDERGHITESSDNRVKMMNKRMGKLDLAAREIPSSRKIAFHGPQDADVTIVGWGSTRGSILDAMSLLREREGITANFVQVRLLRPFPVEEVSEILKRAKRTLLVEENYQGQLGDVIAAKTGFTVGQRLVKFDGRPFSEEELQEALLTAIREGQPRVAVTHLLP
ncbi:MAG: 2-oxoacid:acceptor oxidoreductase subunit alpha [Dehalococcoidia bacterium]|nr:2-oxoacid:acceptor oxidoreductase subunit alpha [Dehalococcoidia bacterium]